MNTEISIPKTSTVLAALLRADYTTLWGNRRSVIMILIVPVVIVFSWQGMIPVTGGAFVLSNGITVGLVAVGLMGYANAVARDRDKGIFQRLRVSPVPLWAIMVSRLIVQLSIILMLTLVVFIGGFYFDHIAISAQGYLITFFMSIVGGSVYLSMGQAIVGRIKSAELVSSTTRLVYIFFMAIGMFGEMGVLGIVVKGIVEWTPYGTVKTILAASMEPTKWTANTSIALLVTLGYILVCAGLGIKWFKWNTK